MVLKNKCINILIVSLTMCVVGVCFSLFLFSKTTSRIVEFFQKRSFENILQNFITTNGQGSVPPLSFYRKYYDLYGPETILASLKKDPFCHERSHTMGQIIYEKIEDLANATLVCKNACASGCIHGVLMGFFGVNQESEIVSPSQITPALQEKIGQTCNQSMVTKYIGVGNCYHAVGHAIMALVSNDVRAGIDLCRLFQNSGSGAIFYCVTGIYMQRNITLGTIDSMKDDSLYPCSVHEYAAACYRYKIRRLYPLPHQYMLAKKTCLSLSNVQRQGCFHGLGILAAYHLLNGIPYTIENLCSGGNEIDEIMCLEGALPFVNVYDKDLARKTCDVYSTDEKIVCLKAQKITNFGMQRNFERYTVDSKL